MKTHSARRPAHPATRAKKPIPASTSTSMVIAFRLHPEETRRLRRICSAGLSLHEYARRLVLRHL